MTPYLVLDDDMITALTYAAKRGVDTVIIMPHIPDKKSAFMLAHSYYTELIEAGVKIYEYLPGFVHSKTFVSDGEKIFIPSQEEDNSDGLLSGDSGNSGGSGASGRSSDGKININTADSTQLQELNGVGPATAEKIIDYRKQNGRFQSIEDIKNVSGIGDKTYEKLKDHIRV